MESPNYRYLVYFQKNNTMSSNVVRIQLVSLFDEIDRLEKEVKDRRREAQQGKDYCQKLEELIERDSAKIKDVETDTVEIMKQIRDLQKREQFLSSAIANATKSTQFLVQMETQARSQLEEEKLKTDNLKKELND